VEDDRPVPPLGHEVDPAAHLGVLGGVVQQADEHLGQAGGVGLDPDRPLGQSDRERVAARLDQGAAGVDRGGDGLGEIDGRLAHRDIAPGSPHKRREVPGPPISGYELPKSPAPMSTYVPLLPETAESD
jgi:hypothetical protein